MENQKSFQLNKISLLMVFPLLVGCAKVSHLQELLTLKDLSEDRDQQEIRIAKQEENFKKLLQAVTENTLNPKLDQNSLVKEFGEPISTRTLTENEQSLVVWIYKEPQSNFNSPKVYFYLDQSGNCLRWEYFPRNTPSNQSEMEQTQLDVKS